MKQTTPGLMLSALICLLLGAASMSAQTTAKPDKALKGKYQNIEVAAFEIQQGVEFPVDSLNVMMPEIVDELKKLRKFAQVSSASDAKTATDAKTTTDTPVVRLSGTVTQFKAGNRTKRYLVGFGAGATKVVAHIKLIDAATNQVVYEKDVDGKVVIGLFGGNSNGATRGLAKEVAKVVGKNLF